MAENKHNNNSNPTDPQAEEPQIQTEDVAAEGAIGGEEEEADVTVVEVQELLDKIASLETDLAKEKNEYLFLRADFDNYRKRMLKEREELLRNAGEKVLRGLLPIVDDFERGLEATKDVAADAEAVRQGMELIYNKLIKFLADNGVKAMESTGATFDADLHEAIASVPAPDPSMVDKVVDTVQRGYMINDKVLRHAKVAVGQ